VEKPYPGGSDDAVFPPTRRNDSNLFASSPVSPKSTSSPARPAQPPLPPPIVRDVGVIGTSSNGDSGMTSMLP
jgi:hypothetical protein